MQCWNHLSRIHAGRLWGEQHDAAAATRGVAEALREGTRRDDVSRQTDRGSGPEPQPTQEQRLRQADQGQRRGAGRRFRRPHRHRLTPPQNTQQNYGTGVALAAPFPFTKIPPFGGNFCIIDFVSFQLVVFR